MSRARSILTEALNKRTLVSVERVQSSDMNIGMQVGFVLGISSKLVLLQSLSDRIDLDGYEVMRLRDIVEVDADYTARKFHETALRLKKVFPASPPVINLESIPRAISSAQSCFGVVVIHREFESPDECEIGQVIFETDKKYRLRWLTPEATWIDDGRRYPFKEITRLEFGTEYARTLALVADD